MGKFSCVRLHIYGKSNNFAENFGKVWQKDITL